MQEFKVVPQEMTKKNATLHNKDNNNFYKPSLRACNITPYRPVSYSSNIQESLFKNKYEDIHTYADTHMHTCNIFFYM